MLTTGGGLVGCCGDGLNKLTMKILKNDGVTYFDIGPYKFMFGPSVWDGETVFAPLIYGFSLWMWNGYYWQIKITDCTDLDGARYSMQFKVSDWINKFTR
jgi:hypothetical protein